VLLVCPFILKAQSMALAQNRPNERTTKESTPMQTKRLKDVLNDLSQQYQVSILFEEATVNGIMVNPDKVKNGRLESKLDVLLKTANLTYKKVSDNAYVVLMATPSKTIQEDKPTEKTTPDNFRKSETSVSTPQNQTKGTLATKTKLTEANEPIQSEIVEQSITGKVTDAQTGEGLPGVSVVVKGTQKGTITDTEGAFSISVPDRNTTLIFSFVGFIAQEILVGNSSILNVSMTSDLNQLNEMVVVGYGEQRKSDLTGAVTSLQTKDITRANPTMASKAIQGQVAGATVTKLNNKPGTGYSITIRGENTINNSTEPLVVIDGLMGGNINNLNPNDIQSMDILKDASSTAIYGSRGANGVIIITTKKGISGKPVVSYDAYIGSKVPGHVPKLMNVSQFYKAVYTDRVLEGGTGAVFTAAETANINAGKTADWVDLITNPGFQMGHNLSVAGGNDKTTYRFSGGYLNEDGNVLYTGFKRYNLNAGLDSKLGERFKVGFTTYISYGNINVGSAESLRNAYRARPTGTVNFADLANPTENQDLNIDGYAFWMGINDKQVPNPLADIKPEYSKQQTTNATIMGNAYAEVALLKGLTFRSSLSATSSNERAGVFNGTWTKQQVGAKPRAQYDQRILGSYTLDNILNYNLHLNKHKITLTALQSAFYQKNEAYQIAVSNLPYNSDWYALNTGATVGAINSSLVERSLLSYMGRINYSYNDKYLLTVTGRSDGASQLSEGNKWAFFPSVAVAWRLGEEPFINKLNVFSNLKARISYGEVGNSTVNPYSTQAGVLNTGYDFDGTAAFGFAPLNLGNKNLRWERSNELNFGLDFGLFKGRINASFELYNRKTVDLILNQKISTTLGFSQVIANIGQIENKGVEFTLNTMNIVKGDFSWNTGITFTKNKNKLLQLYGEGLTVDKGNRLFVGYPIRANFDYKFDGIWQTADKDLAAKYGQVPGSVRVVDQNNDGKISTTEGIDDRVYLGTQMPNWIMGITNRVSFKNLDLSFFIYYRDGVQYNNSTLAGTFGEITNTRYNKLASLDYWRSDNPSNTYFGVVAANPYRGAINYQDASFLRVSDITLGYTLPTALMGRLKVSRARVYAQVSNPFLSTKFTGFDPEFNSAIFNDDVPSILYTMGVNVSF
jgi:TonB-dependent starch-binding outer membrane protein SusC